MAQRNAQIEYLVAGGAAGAIARTAIAPIERVKILFQISKGDGTVRKLARDVLHAEGVRSLWKGNSAAVIRVVPYMSVTFLAYEEYKLLLRADSASPAKHVLAGSLAGMTAILVICKARRRTRNAHPARPPPPAPPNQPVDLSTRCCARTARHARCRHGQAALQRRF